MKEWNALKIILGNSLQKKIDNVDTDKLDIYVAVRARNILTEFEADAVEWANKGAAVFYYWVSSQ